MKNLLMLFAAIALCPSAVQAAEPVAPAQPALKITPGKVIVPLDRMRRIWGELINLDLATRTGKFRNESTDEVMAFTVMPYAELLHHAAFGDLQDFRAGERAIFRLHENEKGEWVWLTYIQDEMNMMNGHKEYFHVDSINADKGQFVCTQASLDKSYVREEGIVIETDADTRYWKSGQPAKFSDIKTGDKLRTKTHGVGKGRVRMCWEVFLDDESLLKFQDEQKAVHAKRMAEEGLPGYADTISDREVQLTLFREAGDQARQLKPGKKIRVAPAGVDRQPAGAPRAGTVASAQMAGVLGKVTITLDAVPDAIKPGGLVRLWTAP